MYIQVKELVLSEAFLGKSEKPEITELIELLKNYEGQAVFVDRWNERLVLDYFLSGSEDLWGMIDWENGSCDFDTQLFRDMLAVSDKYAWDATKEGYQPLGSPRKLTNFYKYESYQQLAEEGKVPIGWLYNDGGHVTCNATRAIVLNANSEYKEGAWEFVNYLLTEGQNKFTWELAVDYPVKKAAYDEWARKEIESGSYIATEKNGHMTKSYKAGYDVIIEAENGVAEYKALYDLTEEKAEEIKGVLEDARLLPTRILPILEIIYEEADAYFTGSKTIEEVIPIIENRVQLYLDEKN